MGAKPSTTNQVNATPPPGLRKSQTYFEKRAAEKNAKENQLVDNLFHHRDNNGETMFHRAAGCYSIGIFEEAKQHNEDRNITSHEQDQYDKKMLTPLGVSPLMISIYNSRDDLGPERYEFIKYQIN